MTKLIDLPALGRTFDERLARLGIRTTDDLLAAAQDPVRQNALASDGPFDLSILRSWLRHADLLRISGVTLPQATRLIALGHSSTQALARLEPKTLASELQELEQRAESAMGAPDVATCRGWIDAAKSLPSSVWLPEDVAAEAATVEIATAVEFLVRDKQHEALGRLAIVLLGQVQARLALVPERHDALLAFAPNPETLLLESDASLAEYLVAMRAVAAEIVPEDVPASHLEAWTPGAVRSYIAAPKALEAANRFGRDNETRWALALEARYYALRLSCGSDETFGFPLPSLVGAASSLEEPPSPRPRPADLTEIEDRLRELASFFGLRAGELQRALADASPNLDSALLGFTARNPRELYWIAALQARLRKLEVGKERLRVARASAELERLRRRYTSLSVFAARTLAALRRGTDLGQVSLVARSLPLEAEAVTEVSVVELLTSSRRAPRLRVFGRRLDAAGALDRLRLCDLDDPSKAVEVILPRADERLRLIYKPPCVAVLVDPLPSQSGVFRAHAMSDAFESWLEAVARDTVDIFQQWPAGVEWTQVPSLPEANLMVLTSTTPRSDA